MTETEGVRDNLANALQMLQDCPYHAGAVYTLHAYTYQAVMERLRAALRQVDALRSDGATAAPTG